MTPPDLLRRLRELSGAQADATRTPTPRSPREMLPPVPVMRGRMAGATPMAPNPTSAQQLAQLVAEIAPVSGEVIGVRRAADAASEGDYGDAAGELGLAALGVVPVGDGVKVLKNLLKNSDRVPSRLPRMDVDGVMRPVLNAQGQLIHPTEEGIRNFWRYFGDSKMVDPVGRPKVLHHGTGRFLRDYSDDINFDVFRKNEIDDGFGWFASNKKQSEIYDGGRIIDAYLRFTKPVVVPDSYGKTVPGWMAAMRKSGVDTQRMFAKPWDGFGDGENYQFWEILENNYGQNNILDELKRQGFDGLIAPAENGVRGRNFLSLSPNNIKSVDNSGAFSRTDPRITAAILASFGIGGAANHNERPE